MKQTIEIGSTPCEEPCAQVGDADYESKAWVECQAYIKQLQRLYLSSHAFPLCDEGVRLRIKANSHDFGTYHEVVAVFDDEDPDAIDAAIWLENNLPEHWDEQAKKELGL